MANLVSDYRKPDSSCSEGLAREEAEDVNLFPIFSVVPLHTPVLPSPALLTLKVKSMDFCWDWGWGMRSFPSLPVLEMGSRYLTSPKRDFESVCLFLIPIWFKLSKVLDAGNDSDSRMSVTLQSPALPTLHY